MSSQSESEREKILAQARELEQLGAELRAKFPVRHSPVARLSGWRRFFSRDRRYFWRMPAWLWVPLVLLLCSLFAVALVSASR
jgi:hypothetical protein